jgi:hypothetical protein
MPVVARFTHGRAFSSQIHYVRDRKGITAAVVRASPVTAPARNPGRGGGASCLPDIQRGPAERRDGLGAVATLSSQSAAGDWMPQLQTDAAPRHGRSGAFLRPPRLNASRRPDRRRLFLKPLYADADL